MPRAGPGAIGTQLALFARMYDAEESSPRRNADAPAARVGPAEGTPLELRRVVSAVAARRWWIALALLVGGAAGVALAVNFAPREFAAQALLSWDPAVAHADGRDATRELRTLTESVNTPAVLAEVRKTLSLTLTLEGLAKRVEVQSNEKSNLLIINAAAASPESALALARTVVDVFQRQRIEFERRRRLESARAAELAEQAALAEVATLRAAFDEFRKQEKVTDLGAQVGHAMDDASRLGQEQVNARADGIAEAARAAALEEELQRRSPSVVLAERTVRPEGTRLAELESELAGLRGGGLSKDHPRITMLEAQAAALRGSTNWGKSVITERSLGRNPQISALEARIADANASRQAALGRGRALQQLTQEALLRVDQLKDIESRASSLVRSLRAAETHLAEIATKKLQALDAARSPVTGLALLEAPELPVRPRRSLRKQVAAATMVLSGLLAVLAIVAYALRGLRVHTAGELAFWGAAPVIFSSEWPARGDGEDVRLDLAQGAEAAPGTTLVVPAGEAESAAVFQLGQLAGWPTAEEATDKTPVRVWTGDPRGPAMRRAARHVERVLVLVTSGSHAAPALSAIAAQLGTDARIAYALVSVPPELSLLPDRVGDARAFWFSAGEAPRLRAVT